MKTKYIVSSVLGILVLGVAYWGISPLFHNIQANDALPSSSTASDTNMAQGGAKSPDVPTSGQPLSGTNPATVTGTLGHPASGTVRIIQSDGKQYVRYENFKTINGPDIYVYLSKDLDAKEYINLGKVRATEGNINYVIPDRVNPADYPYVLTWCKTFGVLFNSAKVY